MTKHYFRLIFILIIGVLISRPGLSQVNVVDENTKTDKPEKKKKDKKPPKTTGWVPGPLPVVSYDSDLGLQVGALVKFLNYGDGSRYPTYNDKLYVEASWFLKGSGIFRVYYDSDRLIKGIRTSIDVSYIPDQLFKFFGFNGYEAVYNADWEDDENPVYKSRAFYRYKRKFFRAKVDFQGSIVKPHLRWLAGADFYSFTINPVDIDHLNDGKPDDKQLPDTIGLYQQYIDWNILTPNEADGGMLTAFKLGLVYDSRDNEFFPTKGIWSEILFIGAPKFTSNMEQGFSKISIIHRQYIPLVKKQLIFVYRLGLQSRIAGHVPYYAQGLMFYSIMTGAYNEGLGGGGTIRGAQRNRIVGDGFVYGNFELRWRSPQFYFIKGHRTIGISAFFDTGRDIQFVDVQDVVNNETIVYPEGETEADYFNFGGEKFHNTFGAGLYLWVSPNFIISADYGRALNRQDGVDGFYIGINYLF